MKTKLIVFLLIAAVAVSAGYLLLRDRDGDIHYARITRDGVELELIDLDHVSEGFSRLLEDESGSNLLSVEPGRICISEADCPDQICVNQGWISDGTVPIVCLPHKLMVEIIGAEDYLDGGAG